MDRIPAVAHMAGGPGDLPISFKMTEHRLDRVFAYRRVIDDRGIWASFLPSI